MVQLIVQQNNLPPKYNIFSIMHYSGRVESCTVSHKTICHDINNDTVSYTTIIRTSDLAGILTIVLWYNNCTTVQSRTTVLLLSDHTVFVVCCMVGEYQYSRGTGLYCSAYTPTHIAQLPYVILSMTYCTELLGLIGNFGWHLVQYYSTCLWLETNLVSKMRYSTVHCTVH